MTQAEFGAEIGFTGSHVSKLERGLTEPSEEIIFSICNVTSARYEWLKNEDGPMFANEIPPVDYASVGLRIRNARKAQGLTQLELAERIDDAFRDIQRSILLIKCKVLGVFGNITQKKDVDPKKVETVCLSAYLLFLMLVSLTLKDPVYAQSHDEDYHHNRLIY